MGSGSSVATSPPKKPSEYSQEKWQKICQLFDHLDSNSDFVIDTGDTKTLTNTARSIVQRDIQAKERDYNYLVTELKKTEQAKRQQFEKELKAWSAKSTAEIQVRHSDICSMKSYTDSQACAYFVKQAGKGEQLTFHRFFEYMKDKV